MTFAAGFGAMTELFSEFTERQIVNPARAPNSRSCPSPGRVVRGPGWRPVRHDRHLQNAIFLFYLAGVY